MTSKPNADMPPIVYNKVHWSVRAAVDRVFRVNQAVRKTLYWAVIAPLDGIVSDPIKRAESLDEHPSLNKFLEGLEAQ